MTTKLVTFKVTPAMREEIDEQVRKGLAKTRSDLVREAVEMFLREESRRDKTLKLRFDDAS